jgi:mono/diheme cytochrome c family protein
MSARDRPSDAEAWIARCLRSWATPSGQSEAPNPVAPSEGVLSRARAHFADHCALCHGNDGRGRTEIGQALYPKAPDMTLGDTQSLSDGELFAIIENGVRLSGMPAWGQPGPQDDEETWELVHFIRHLTSLTPEQLAEMEELNPRSRRDLEEAAAVQEFLSGGKQGPGSAHDRQH